MSNVATLNKKILQNAAIFVDLFMK